MNFIWQNLAKCHKITRTNITLWIAYTTWHLDSSSFKQLFCFSWLWEVTSVRASSTRVLLSKQISVNMQINNCQTITNHWHTCSVRTPKSVSIAYFKQTHLRWNDWIQKFSNTTVFRHWNERQFCEKVPFNFINLDRYKPSTVLLHGFSIVLNECEVNLLMRL